MRRSPRLLAITVLLAGCGGQSPTAAVTTMRPGESATASAVTTSAPAAAPSGNVEIGGPVWYTCGADEPFDPTTLDHPARDEMAASPQADALRTFVSSGDYMDVDMPTSGWTLVRSVPDAAQFLARNPSGRYTVVVIGPLEGTWQPVLWGECTPRAAVGDATVATWNYAPEVVEPLPPTTTRFDAIVTERGCTGGQPMGDRLLAPAVHYGDAQVTIIFAARRLTGELGCEANPPERVTVTLDQPIGNRALRDGGIWPHNDPAVVLDDTLFGDPDD